VEGEPSSEPTPKWRANLLVSRALQKEGVPRLSGSIATQRDVKCYFQGR